MTPELVAQGVTIKEISDLVAQGGLLTLLLLILWSGKQKIWRWGHEFDEREREWQKQLHKAEERAEKFEAVAFRLAGITEKAVNAAVSKDPP